MRRIDLRSDTVTLPSPGMRDAMLRAELGDDVYGEDPTVNDLQARAARWTGKQAALFLPSGTMANQVALRSHTEPGDATVACRGSHVALYEGGGAAALSGVHLELIGDEGRFSPAELEAAIAPADAHFARTRLVWVENTHNRSGGSVFPFGEQQALAKVAARAGLRMHLDGARIFNAAAATGRSIAELAEPYDSVSFCLSKGLGAPVGSLLCGPEAWIARAHRFRKMYGGGMRQAGVLAAAGLYALEHNVKRISEDHANAAQLADGIQEIAGLTLAKRPETNIVLFRCQDADAFVARASAAAVLVNALDRSTLRAVTHLGVDRDEIQEALGVFETCAR